MDKTYPDKWIRKAISEVINGLVVDTFTIPIFDQNVTSEANSEDPEHYILMKEQSNEVDKTNKCEWNWNSQILLEIYTYYPKTGNTGSRLLADNIMEAVKDLTNNLVLDPASDLKIIFQTPSFPNDIVTDTKSELVFRKFLRLEFFIQ